jgi:hypothetical protein
MFTRPAIAEAPASQRRRDLNHPGRACRLARAARNSTPSRPSLLRIGRRPVSLGQPTKRTATAAAVFAAAAVLRAAPA